MAILSKSLSVSLELCWENDVQRSKHTNGDLWMQLCNLVTSRTSVTWQSYSIIAYSDFT